MGTSVRRSVRSRTIGVGLAAVALASGAVSCSKGGEESPEMTPAAAVAKAAKNTEEITSFHYRMKGEMPEAGQVQAEAAMRTKPDLAMSMKMTAAGQGSAEIRLVDKAMYIGGNPELAKEMDGKKWMKFDLSALGKDGGLGAAAPGAGQADQNPASMSSFLNGAKDVKKVGTETIDGVKTTHYAGDVTLAELKASFKDADKSVREQREKSTEQLEKLGLDKFTMDMWVDAQQHAKQFRMQGDATKGKFDMTFTFLDYNKPVTVEAPPANETADLAQMMKELQSS
ncbi:LppX_LprAFG lipoprotein [Streptomyces sp. 351MFTsu5.1]|uniref:LppX_LprAFG lipoprotein n=1 Tax=Streptomyces sp. 351MFTsu5.1 TaxID=1172180 RepID=UPI00039E721E|nr:LppX_LprAFG lipoprotein [Streptomyces sp. 351MFTsu5.1]